MIFLWIFYTNPHPWICSMIAKILMMGHAWINQVSASHILITPTALMSCCSQLFFTYSEFYCQIWLNFVDESTIKRSILNIAHDYFSCCSAAKFFPIVFHIFWVFFYQIWMNFVFVSTMKRSILNFAHTYSSYCNDAPIHFDLFWFFKQIWPNFVDEIERSIFNIAHTYFSCCSVALFFLIVFSPYILSWNFTSLG